MNLRATLANEVSSGLFFLLGLYRFETFRNG